MHSDRKAVNLLDPRGVLIWGSHQEFWTGPYRGKSILDVVLSKSRQKLERALTACVVHGKRTQLTVHLMDLKKVEAGHSRTLVCDLIPVYEPTLLGAACCVISIEIPDDLAGITATDLKIMRMLAEGATERDIAKQIRRQPGGVQKRIQELKRLAACRTIAQLVATSKDRGLI